MSRVSGCWPHGIAHFHTQLASGQHLHHHLLACSKACLATVSPLSCPVPWHSPTAFLFPHPWLAGQCQPLCQHGRLLTTTAIQETPRKPSLGSRVLVQVPRAPPQPTFQMVRKPRELQILRLDYPRHRNPKLDYYAGAVGLFRCAASRYSAPGRGVQQLPRGLHSTAHLDSIEDFTHYFHAFILVLHVPHLQTEEPEVI